MIITLASSKGGVGKSTLTGCLAGAWAAAGDTVHIVDLDSNRTISRWFSDATRRPRQITLAAPDPSNLTEHLESIIELEDPNLILIDVAGNYERALTHAVVRAHLTLIPATPTEADLFEASRIAKHITILFNSLKQQPLYRLALNRVQPLSSTAQLFTITEMIRLQLPRIKTKIMQRAAYEEVGLSGLPPHFAEDRKRPTVAKAIVELDAFKRDIDELIDAHTNPTTLNQGAA